MAIKINGATVISDSQAITSTSTISAAGNVTAGNVSVVGTVVAAGINTGSSPISTAGNITGGYIFGNGSQLTGIDATGIQSGTSNVKVLTTNGNIVINAGTTKQWLFDTAGNLTVPTATYIQTTVGSNGNINFHPDGNGAVNIQGNTAGSLLFVSSDTANSRNRIEVDTFGPNATLGGSFIGRFARGGLGSPSAVLGSDRLGSVKATGYDGTTYPDPSGTVSFDAVGNWSPSSYGTAISFWTTPTGTTTTQKSSQLLSIGDYQQLIGNILVSSGLISASGNITGGNVLTGGAVSATANVTGGNVLTGGIVSSTGNITGGNITTTGIASIGGFTISGNTLVTSGQTFTIDPNGVGSTDGLVVINGNLQVNGNTTTINSNVVTTNDLTVNYANNAINGSAANGGGIEVGPLGNAFITWLYNNTANTWTSSAGISAVGNITGGNVSVGTGTVTLGGIVNANGNAVGNIGSSTAYFNTVFAKATSAQYADLAEKYTADAAYAPGTVVVFGGTAEVTVNATDGDTKVAGVVSTNPSYIMNGTLEGEHVATVALTGRVPTMIVGPVQKGDLMVAAGLGRARAEADPRVGSVIGKALEDFNGAEGTIEVVVGRF
jgi:filamentous hemagglutinin